MTQAIRSNGYLYTFTDATGSKPAMAENFGQVDDARRFIENLAGGGQAQPQLEQLHAEQSDVLSVGLSWSEKLGDLVAMLADGRLAVVKAPLPEECCYRCGYIT